MKIQTKGDPVAVENLRSLEAHPGFYLVKVRIEQALRQNGDYLIQAKSWDEACRLQGAIHALQMVLDTPHQLIAELKK